MIPEIRTSEKRFLVGIAMDMSLVANETPSLFRAFMPNRKHITNSIGSAVYDMRIYPRDYFIQFSPQIKFQKWAAMQVSDFNDIPHDMDSFTLVSGLYAVFTPPSTSSKSAPFTYIFQEWLPNSNYMLDDRPHFDLIEPGPTPGTSEKEEIWIPIQPK